MKFIPILFSTAMVQALQAGTKTQTRRVVKNAQADDRGYRYAGENFEDYHGNILKCPYGAPGDILWVRETFKPDWDEDGTEQIYFYKSDFPDDIDCWAGRWKPSIFMPRAACRLFLKIKSIRVERLQEISEADAIAEGIEKWDSVNYKIYGKYAGKTENAKKSYSTLWQSINEPESWEANPWVWVVEFERVEKPDNF